jgi:hypothetical protein
MKILEGYKTYLVAFAAVLIAVGAAIQDYYGGSVINYQLIIDSLVALALIFLRKGIKDTK